MTIGADSLLEESLDPLHTLLVFDLGECVLNGVDRVVICKIEFRRLLGLRVEIENMLFLGGAVIDHFLLGRCEVLKGDVRADAHLAAHILHQGPHERAPDDDSAFVDRQIFIGHQLALVHCSRDARSTACRTRASAVEGQFLRAGTVKAGAADRADLLPSRRHIHRRVQIVPIGTPVAGKP